MVIENLCILELWTKVALALKRLTIERETCLLLYILNTWGALPLGGVLRSESEERL